MRPAARTANCFWISRVSLLSDSDDEVSSSPDVSGAHLALERFLRDPDWCDVRTAVAAAAADDADDAVDDADDVGDDEGDDEDDDADDEEAADLRDAWCFSEADRRVLLRPSRLL